MRQFRGKTVDIAFVACMSVLFFAFATLLVINPSGNQIQLFFRGTEDFFADYFNAADTAAELTPYYSETDGHASIDRQYPPFAYAIFYLLSRLADYRTLSAFEAGYTTVGLATAVLAIMLIVLISYALLQYAYSKRGPLAVLLPLCLITSSVFLFAIERANIILLAFVCLFLFILTYRSSNKLVFEISLILLAVATAIKGYPAAFGVLLLFDKKFAASVRCAIYACVLVFAPFLLFDGGFNNIPIWIQNIIDSSAVYKVIQHAFGSGSVVYYATQFFPGVRVDGLFATITEYVFKVVCVFGLLTSFFLPKQWQRILLIGASTICLQSGSATYLGLYLFMGIALFFHEEEHVSIDWLIVLLFVLFLNPLQLIIGDLNLTQFLMGMSVNVILFWLAIASFISCAKAIHERFGLRRN